MRADLICESRVSDGRPILGVKDPIRLSYFELPEESGFVFLLLDGNATIRSLCEAFQLRYRPRVLSEDEVRRFVGQLVSLGLVVAEAPGYGSLLLTRRSELQSRHRWGKLLSLLAIRFRGIDPDRWLGVTVSWLHWLFSPWAVVAGVTLIVSALALVVVQFDELQARLPETQALLSASNLIWLSALLAIVKVLHELGHGLTCKRFGGECHELGVMLLVFTPTLYCNVSDAWTIRSKWKRMAVSGAGMWVEMVIAAVATMLWWFSQPGLFHTLCLNLMFLCGVSTLLLNGNPLLRYDGYFVLADWLEIPNLQQQAQSSVRSMVSSWFCGFRTEPEPAPLRHMGLLAYGIASAAYRVMVTGLMLWGLHHWLQPWGLGAIAQLLAVPTIMALALAPLLAASRFLVAPANRNRIRWLRFWSRSLLTVVTLVALFAIPIPMRVSAGALVDDGDAQRVYVTMAGRLVEALAIGQSVEAGQVVARLEDPQRDLRMAEMTGKLELQKQRLESLERRRVSEPQLALEASALREAIRDLEQQLVQQQADGQRLVLRAPRAGTVLPVPRREPQEVPGALPTWNGSPLEERNRDCFLSEGTTVCLVGTRHSHFATLLISQDDIDLVRVGQWVRLRWDELTGDIAFGTIEELAALEEASLSPQEMARMDLPQTPDRVHLLGTWYRARVRMDEHGISPLRGSAGQARIEVSPRPLGSRLARWFRRTFAM